MNNFLRFAGIVATTLFLLTGCGDGDGNGNGNGDAVAVTGEGVETVAAETTGTPTDLDLIRERGYLVVGTFGDRPPFGTVEADGSLQGLDPFIARRFAYELFGDEDAVEFVVTDAASRIEFLRSNRVDLIMATFTVTEERQEQVHFALPYMTVHLGIVAPEANGITSAEDLHGQTLIVTTGTTAEIYFTMNHPQVELLRFGANTESFNALLDGRGAAMAHDDTLLHPWAFANPGHTVVGGIGNTGHIAPAVNLESTYFLAWLDETILDLRSQNFFYDAFDATLRDNFVAGTEASSIMVN